MTMIERSGVLVLVTVLFVGCASTNVNRAKDVSSAGIHYAQTTSDVVGVAIDSIIDTDSETQVRIKPRSTETFSADERKKQLKDSDEGLIRSVVYYDKLRSSIGTLGAYFQALQALADGSQADATQAAVTTLADRVNSLNGALEAGGPNTPKPLLSDDQKNALAGLSNVVAKQVHGAVVGQALARDAPIIGKAILLQQRVLVQAETDISAGMKLANDKFYLDKVLKPYQTATMDSAWVDDRRTYIKVAALGQTLETVKSAQAASKQMEAAWRKILSGDYNVAEINAMLRETDELLAAVVKLKTAEKPKAATP